MIITVRDSFGLHIINVDNICSMQTNIEDSYIHIVLRNGTNLYLEYKTSAKSTEALEEISRLIEEKQK